MASRSDIKAGGVIVEVGTNLKGLQAGLAAAQKQISAFGARMNSIGKSISSTMASFALPAIATGGAGMAAAWPVKMAAELEQAQIMFEVFLGSAAEATKMLSQLRDMAAKTPFTTGDLADASRLLMGFGATAQNVLPYMRMLGDISGGNAERFHRLSLAFGQTLAKGRLMGQEVIQMTEQGFNPLAEISRQTGESMASLMKRMENGEVSFSMLVSAMQAATGQGGRFNGMMEKQSKTLYGTLSTLRDYAMLSGAAIGETLLPALKRIVNVSISVVKAFNAIIERNKEIVGTIAKVVAIAGVMFVGFLAAGAVAGLFSAAFASIIGVAASIAGAIAAILSPLGVALALAGGLAGYFMYASGALSVLGQVGQAVFGQLGQAWAAFTNAIANGDIQAAFGVVSAGLQLAWATAMDYLQNAWNASVAFVMNVWTGITSQIAQIGLTAFVALQNAWDSVWTNMKALAIDAIWGVASIVNELTSRVEVLLLMLEQAWTGESRSLSITNADNMRQARNEQYSATADAARNDMQGGLAQRSDQRQQDVAKIIAAIQQDAANAMQGRLGNVANTREESAKRLADAQKAFADSINKANTATPTDAKIALPDLLMQAIGMAQPVDTKAMGTFSSRVAGQIGTLGVEDRTLRAAERTAKATEAMAQELRAMGVQVQ